MQPPCTTQPVYVVKPGDSLDDIASQFGTTVDAFMALNTISSPNYILPGEVLCVPSKASPPPPGGDNQSPSPSCVYPNYMPQSGDDLEKLATEFGTSLDAILSANDFSGSDQIVVGQPVCVPNYKVSPLPLAF